MEQWQIEKAVRDGTLSAHNEIARREQQGRRNAEGGDEALIGLLTRLAKRHLIIAFTILGISKVFSLFGLNLSDYISLKITLGQYLLILFFGPLALSLVWRLIKWILNKIPRKEKNLEQLINEFTKDLYKSE